MNYLDTITALATPVGSGALHIIRVSGEDAIEQVANIFQPREKLLKARSHSLVYGKIIAEGKLLDEVLCSVFLAPNSFTGENSVEISCHGSMFDLAGRVYKGVPAPTNLVVPPYSFESDSVIVIGVDQEAA